MSVTPRVLVDANCPDPAALVVGDELWLVCTTNDNNLPDKFPLRRTRDLATFEQVGHVFPRGKLPSWAVEDFWAPEIFPHAGGYHCYFTARHKDGQLALGLARADKLEGPWEDLGRPLFRDEAVGMIDAHRFDRDGESWLVWKADGNAFDPPRPTPLFTQRLAPDGMTLTGPRTEILTNDLPWEGDVVEGPWVVKRPDALYLFYAANKFNSDKYATGVARAKSLDVPFEKLGSPILVSDAAWWGPGHGCAVTFRGQELFIYHAWVPNEVDVKWNVSVYPRKALAAPITWGADGWPRFGDDPALSRPR